MFAIRVRRVASEYFQEGDKKPQLFERKLNVMVVNMPININVELGCVKSAPELVAFQFRNIDRVCGEAT